MSSTSQQAAASKLDEWLEGYLARSGQSGDQSRQALAYLQERLISQPQGEETALTCLEALNALRLLSPDTDTVSACLLLPLSDDDHWPLPDEIVVADSAVQQLLEQLRRLTWFGQTYLSDDHSRAEGLRRLLLALVADVRVVLIALAWQLGRLRRAAASNASAEVKQQLGRETQLIHAPLANRLGIWQLKWELEDLAFRYLEPRTYDQIRRLVAERRADREAFIQRFITTLETVVGDAGIQADISGRAKHIYSIWRKMQRKGLDFHELFDVRAVRVMVDSVADCYTVLGLVHTHWQPVPGEFDDYITNPKANLYQSLHTAVAGTGGRVVEVQIRTHDMHRHAELGVAAHWRYKEGGPRDPGLEKRIGAMRKLLESGEGQDDEDLLESFSNVTSEDRVYVLTPKGEVRDLSAGATPLDFAYLVHTEIGHRCRGARINGRIVPLTTELKNGDRVEILTAKEPRPSRDWLSARSGYLRTARARSKVRQWFRHAQFEDNLAAGRQTVEAEFRRLDLDTGDLAKVVGNFNLREVDELLAAVGSGDITASQVAGAVERWHAAQAAPPSSLNLQKRPQAERDNKSDVQIEGVGNLMHQMARCCQPVPGDSIGGFITRGRGISIHRQDCRQFISLSKRHPERVMDVRWADRSASRYPARIRLDAWDRRELIRDIGTLLATENINVSAMNAQHSDPPEQVTIELTVQVADFEQLASLLSKMQTIPNVTSARRLR